MLFVTNFIQLTSTQQVSYEGLGDFRIEGQIIRTVKQPDDLVLLTVEETVLQGRTDRVTAAERC